MFISKYKKWSELEIALQFEEISDQIWKSVSKWDYFSKQSIGIQLVKSIDSITANLNEGQGRFHYKEKLNFLYYARGSLYESKAWIAKSIRRELLAVDEGENILNKLDELAPKLNAFISHIKNQ